MTVLPPGPAAGLLVLALALLPGAARAERPKYPPTPVREVADTLHGEVVTDPYRWLEDSDAPEVQAWTRAQNQLTQEWLARWPGRDSLRSRLAELFALDEVGSPEVCGDRYFFRRREGLQNHAVLYVRQGRPDAPRRVALDPNTFSSDGTVALDWEYPSPDGRLVAYGKSAGGDEQSTLYVRDVDSAGDLRDVIPNTARASVAWDPDGRGFCYTRHPAKGRVPAGEEVFHVRIFHHRLGAEPGLDPVVVDKEGRPVQENLAVYASSDHRWLFYARTLDWAKNDLFVRANGSAEAFRPVALDLDGVTRADGYGDRLFLLTNVNAPRCHVVAAPAQDPRPANWHEIVPQGDGVITAIRVVGGRLAVLTEEAAVSRLFLYSLDGKLEREIPTPAPGAISGVSGRPDGTELFFDFESFTYPPAVYRYDLASGRLSVYEKVEAGFDPGAYETRQVMATSKDGTRVPLFVVARRGLPRDGNQPTLLTGYGGFAISETPRFRAPGLAWLERGGVFAAACLRGGQEYGRSWHEAGRLGRKQNVFDDFYACARWLVDSSYTRPGKLGAVGGSNGGLLVGAALTQRPELFGAIVCQVPLLDMLRYDRFLIGRLWIPEYGTATDPQQFAWLRAYSPYQNVKPGTSYPATLFTAGEGDSRVHPLHARKMAALVQAASAGEAPILLRVEGKAGHGQGKPTSKRLDEAVDIYGFLMMQLGV